MEEVHEEGELRPLSPSAKGSKETHDVEKNGERESDLHDDLREGSNHHQVEGRQKPIVLTNREQSQPDDDRTRKEDEGRKGGFELAKSTGSPSPSSTTDFHHSQSSATHETQKVGRTPIQRTELSQSWAQKQRREERKDSRVQGHIASTLTFPHSSS